MRKRIRDLENDEDQSMLLSDLDYFNLKELVSWWIDDILCTPGPDMKYCQINCATV